MPPTYSQLYCRLIFRGIFVNDSRNESVRCASKFNHNWFTPYENVLTKKWWRNKFLGVQQMYEEVIGLKEVQDAQNRVIDAEKYFMLAQEERRKFYYRLAEVQNKLKEIHAELDKTNRGEERYIQLVTMEHGVRKEERAVSETFQEKERAERDYFSAFSSALKMSHEKERAHSERTKYWSIIASMVGTLLGLLGSTITNDLRMRELRDLVKKAVNVKNQNDVTVESIVRNLNLKRGASVGEKKITDDQDLHSSHLLAVVLCASLIVIVVKALC